MKYPITRFKNMEVALKQLDRLVSDCLHCDINELVPRACRSALPPI
jgi:hypothetical protein